MTTDTIYQLAKQLYAAYIRYSWDHNKLFEHLKLDKQQRWFAVAEEAMKYGTQNK
jgi:hypothetical protein